MARGTVSHVLCLQRLCLTGYASGTNLRQQPKGQKATKFNYDAVRTAMALPHFWWNLKVERRPPWPVSIGANPSNRLLKDNLSNPAFLMFIHRGIRFLNHFFCRFCRIMLKMFNAHTVFDLVGFVHRRIRLFNRFCKPC